MTWLHRSVFHSHSLGAVNQLNFDRLNKATDSCTFIAQESGAKIYGREFCFL